MMAKVCFFAFVLVCVSAVPSTREKVPEKPRVDAIKIRDASHLQNELSYTSDFHFLNPSSKKAEHAKDPVDVPKVRVPPIVPRAKDTSDSPKDCDVIRFMLELACYDVESKERILRDACDRLPDTKELRDLVQEQLEKKLEEIEKLESDMAAQRTKIASLRGRLRTERLRAKERANIANKARAYAGRLVESKHLLRKCRGEETFLSSELERREDYVEGVEKAHQEAEAAVTVAGIQKNEIRKDLEECECA